MSVVIIYGALRSGSTLLRLMINGHSQLSCTGEHDYLFDHLQRTGTGWAYDLSRFDDDRIFRAHGLTAPSTSESGPALQEMLDQIAKAGGKRISVLMIHRHLERALDLLPEAKVIHLLRDPRDVARSWVGMGWQGNAYRAVEGWMATEEGWIASAGKRTGPTEELRYETLVAEPEAELARICAFLDLEYEEGLLSYPDSTTYDKPDARLAEQWRRKMSPRELSLVEARLGPLLAETGYAPSGQPQITISATQRLALDLHSAYGRWRHLIGRYGLLPIQRGLGRRLGMKSVEQTAQRKIDALMTEHYLK